MICDQYSLHSTEQVRAYRFGNLHTGKESKHAQQNKGSQKKMNERRGNQDNVLTEDMIRLMTGKSALQALKICTHKGPKTPRTKRTSAILRLVRISGTYPVGDWVVIVANPNFNQSKSSGFQRTRRRQAVQNGLNRFLPPDVKNTSISEFTM